MFEKINLQRIIIAEDCEFRKTNRNIFGKIYCWVQLKKSRTINRMGKLAFCGIVPNLYLIKNLSSKMVFDYLSKIDETKLDWADWMEYGKKI